MMPKLVCSLARRSAIRKGETPLCMQLFRENKELKRERDNLLVEAEWLRKNITHLEHKVEEFESNARPWWKWW